MYNVKMVAKFNSNETARRFASHVYPFGHVPDKSTYTIADNTVVFASHGETERDVNALANTVRSYAFSDFSNDELLSFETTITKTEWDTPSTTSSLF